MENKQITYFGKQEFHKFDWEKNNPEDAFCRGINVVHAALEGSQEKKWALLLLIDYDTFEMWELPAIIALPLDDLLAAAGGDFEKVEVDAWFKRAHPGEEYLEEEE